MVPEHNGSVYSKQYSVVCSHFRFICPVHSATPQTLFTILDRDLVRRVLQPGGGGFGDRILWRRGSLRWQVHGDFGPLAHFGMDLHVAA